MGQMRWFSIVYTLQYSIGLGAGGWQMRQGNGMVLGFQLRSRLHLPWRYISSMFTIFGGSLGLDQKCLLHLHWNDDKSHVFVL